MRSPQLCRANLALNCTLKLKVKRRVVEGTMEMIANSILKEELKSNCIFHW